MSDLEQYGKVAYGEWAAAERRFMRSPEAWEKLSPTAQASFIAAGQGVANAVISGCRWCGDEAKRCPGCGTPLTVLHHDLGCTEPCGACEASPPADGGQWMRIAFMGHVTLTGYVTVSEVGGHAVYHVDLPEKLWGGNPLAWREYAASALYSREPVTEQAVRAAWEARERARRAWEARPALEAVQDDEGGEECVCGHGPGAHDLDDGPCVDCACREYRPVNPREGAPF